jgi:hypothetical protein
MTPSHAPVALETVIVDLCAKMPTGRTICPTDAAKAYAAERGEDDLGWRSHLHEVRKAAVKLALAGRLVIYRKGKPVDPSDFRGVYRLGSPSLE